MKVIIALAALVAVAMAASHSKACQETFATTNCSGNATASVCVDLTAQVSCDSLKDAYVKATEALSCKGTFAYNTCLECGAAGVKISCGSSSASLAAATAAVVAFLAF